MRTRTLNRVLWHLWQAAAAVVLLLTAWLAAEHVHRQHRRRHGGADNGDDDADDPFDVAWLLYVLWAVCCCCWGGHTCRYRRAASGTGTAAQQEDMRRNVPVFAMSGTLLVLLLVALLAAAARCSHEEPHSANRHLLAAWWPAFAALLALLALLLVYLAVGVVFNALPHAYRFLFPCCRPIRAAEDDEEADDALEVPACMPAPRGGGDASSMLYNVCFLLGIAGAGAALVAVYRALQGNAGHAASWHHWCAGVALFYAVLFSARASHFGWQLHNNNNNNATYGDVVALFATALASLSFAFFLLALPAIEPAAPHGVFEPLYVALLLLLAASCVPLCCPKHAQTQHRDDEDDESPRRSMTSNSEIAVF